jgi:hypothetical protein
MRSLLSTLFVLHAGPALAQGNFDVALSVQRAGREIGREEYSLSRSGARSGGTLLTALARYPASGATLRIDAQLERTPDLSIAKFELDVQAPEGNVVILAAGSGTRLIVRSVTKGSEAGREMPGGREIVLLDENVYSLYLPVVELATPAGAELTAVFPRTGRRASFVARREPGAGGGTRTQLSGGITGTILTGSDGRLERVELPGAGIVVSKLSK